MVAQPRQYPALCHLDSHLDLCLVTRFAGACGQNGSAIMRRHLGVGPVQPRIKPVGLDHGRLQIVRNDGLWHTTQKGEHPDVGKDPILQPCRGHRFGKV